MCEINWVTERNEDQKYGVLVRHSNAGVALSMAEEVAKQANRELLEQWPRPINRDGAMHWFFEYRQ